jgi:CBS domain-containing protein
MTAGAICVRDVVIAGPAMPVQEAAGLMRDYHVGSLVVAEEINGKTTPVGILTDRDLVVEVLAKGQDAEGITVGDVMSDHLMLVVENESLWNVIQRMRSEGVRRVPVVDSGGALVGILSVDDMLQLLGDELSALGRLIGNEQEHEARRRDQP